MKLKFMLFASNQNKQNKILGVHIGFATGVKRNILQVPGGTSTIAHIYNPCYSGPDN